MAIYVRDAQILRNIDWLITCPLLLIELYRHGQEPRNGRIHYSNALVIALVACLVMNLCGVLGASQHMSQLLLSIGFASLSIIYASMSMCTNKKNDRYVLTFLSPWILYGLVAMYQPFANSFTITGCLKIQTACKNVFAKLAS